MPTSQPKAFVIRTDRSMDTPYGDSVDFSRYFLIIADSIEKAKTKLHQHILKYTSLGNMPESFFISPDEYLDRFLAQEKPQSELEHDIFEQLDEISASGNLDYEDGNHVLDHDSNSTMLITEVVEYDLAVIEQMEKSVNFIKVSV